MNKPFIRLLAPVTACLTALVISSTAVSLPAISISKTTTPPSPGNGNPFYHSIQITNIGAELITDLKVVDTMPPMSVFISEDHPLGFSFTGYGGVLSWLGTSLSLNPGQTFTFTISGGASLCYTGSVSNTAWAFATSAGGDAQAKALSSYDLSAPIAGISVSLFHATALPVTGGPATYSIVVVNSGTATIYSIKVVETLAAQITFVAQDHSSWPGLNFIQNGRILSWNENPINFAPGQSMTITITGLDSTRWPGTVSNTAWVDASSICSSDKRKKISSFPLLTTDSYRIIAPPIYYSGVPFLITIVAIDASGNTRTGYTGTTSFTSTDPLAKVQNVAMDAYNYTWVAPDAGVKILLVTLSATTATMVDLVDTIDPDVTNSFFLTGTPNCAPSLDIWEETPSPQYAGLFDMIQYRIGFSNSSDCTAYQTTISTRPGSLTGRQIPSPAGWSITLDGTDITSDLGTRGSYSLVEEGTIWGVWFYLNPGAINFADNAKSMQFTIFAIGPHQSGYVNYRLFNRTPTCQLLPAYASATCASASGEHYVVPYSASVTGETTACYIPTSVHVQKTHFPANPGNNDAVTYEILVTNNGMETVTNLLVTDTLPAGITWTSQSNNGAPLTWNGSYGVAAWEGAYDLLPGQTTSIWIDGTTAACFSGFISNTAFIVATTIMGTTEWNAVDAGFSPGVEPELISTVAGIGTNGYNGDGIPAISAQLNDPGESVFDNEGNLYISEYGGNRVRKVDAITGLISTVAGTGAGGYNGDGIPATSAELNFPYCITVDNFGNLFIADSNNSRVRKVDVVTGLISTVAGTGVAGYNGDGIPATMADLTYVKGLAFDASGNLFIADTDNGRVRKVDASTGLISTVAGTGMSNVYNGDGIPATSANLYWPYGLAFDNNGNLYFSDYMENRVRKVDSSTGLISTLAGTGTFSFGYNGDGIPANTAQLFNPTGLALDSSGNLYIADSNNSRIRKIDAGTGLISTVAGTGADGFNGDGIPATSAALGYPYGVTFDSSYNLYIADTTNNRIRKVVMSYPSASIAVREKVHPAVPVFGGPVTYTISVRNISSATITDLVISDTPPAQVTFGGEQHPAGLIFSLAGSQLVWSGAGLTFGPSQTMTVTITGTVTSCFAGTVSNVAMAYSANACNAMHASAQASFTSTTGLSVVKTVSPANPGNGDPVTYRIVVTNTGSATLTQFKIADTLPAQITYTGEDHPAGFSFLNNAGLISWDGAVSLAPGLSLTVTATGTADLVYSGPVSNMAWAYGANACGAAQNTGSVFCNIGIPPISIVKTHTPASPLNNELVYYLLTITNSSTFNIDSFRVVDTLPNEVTFWDLDYPPTVIPDLTGQVFTYYREDWMGYGPLVPGETLTMTITGLTDFSYLGEVSNTAWFSADNSPINAQATSIDSLVIAGPPLDAWDSGDDTSSGATVLVPTSTLQSHGPHTLSSIDYEDWYQFDLTAGTTYEFDSIGGSGDSYAELYSDSAGTMLEDWSDDDGGALQFAISYTPAVDQTYYLRVTTYTPGDNWSGALRYRIVLPPADCSITAFKIHTPVKPGRNGSVTYGIFVQNTGMGTITSLKITDTLSANISWTSQSTTPGPTWNGSYGIAAWEGPVTLYPGETASIWVTGTTPSCLFTGFIPNNALIEASTAMGTTTMEAADSGFYLGGEPELISTIAGNGVGTYNGDGIPAALAQIGQPWGVASDDAGNIYISEFINNRVRKVDAATGLISTVAGTGVAGYNGDGIPATSAKLAQPAGIALDNSGNLYITEYTNQRVRKVDTASGYISTIAGTGSMGYNGDGIPATSAKLGYPVGVAVDGFGNVYIADALNARIRKINAVTGLISTVAGNGLVAFNGDGIPATTAHISASDVAIDKSDNIYIADGSNNRIRKVSASTGLISTVAGTGAGGYNGDGIAATTAQINVPQGVTFDVSGNLLIGDTSNHRVRKIDIATGLISTIAGTGATSYNGDGISPAVAQINSPKCSAVDADGNLFIVDAGNQRIRKVDISHQSASISIQKTVDPLVPVNGSTATYTIVVRNIGPDPITSLEITDTLPALISYTGEQHPAGMVYSLSGATHVWSGSGLDIEPSQSVTVKITGTATLSTTGIVSNVACATSANSCGNGQNSVRSSFNLLPPWLVISTNVNQSPMNPVIGGPVIYQINVWNVSLATVDSIIIVDTLPTGFIFGAEDHSNVPSLSFLNNAGVLSWTGNLQISPATSITVTVTGTASLCHSGNVTNTVWAIAYNAFHSSDQRSTQSFSLTGTGCSTASVSIMKYPPFPPPCNGAQFDYRIVVSNTSTTTITGLKVVDTLPAQVTYVSQQSPAGLVFSNSGGRLAWNGSGLSIGPYSSFTITITGTAAPVFTGFVSNTAWVYAEDAFSSGQDKMNSGFRLPALPTYKIISPATVYAGQNFWITVVVVTCDGNTKTDYTGITSFTSTDPTATMLGGVPMDAWNYNWNGPLEQGVWIFINVKLNTPCIQTISLNDTTYPDEIRGNFSVNVVPGPISSSLYTIPSSVSVGSTVWVTLVVVNAGFTPIASMVPEIAVNSGAGLLNFIAGPVPASSVLTGPGAVGFSWAYMVTGPGNVSFTATANGTPTCGYIPTTSASTSVTVTPTWITQWMGPTPGTTSLTGAPGDTVSYTIQYNVPGGTTTVQIIETIPAYTHYLVGSSSPAPDPGWDPSIGPPSALRWTIPGPFPPTGSTGIITFQLTLDWGNGEAFEWGSGDVAAPQGSVLTSRALALWQDGMASVNSLVNTVNVDWLSFTKSSVLTLTTTGTDEIIYTIVARNNSATKTWWNVSVWDTVPAKIDPWLSGHGFEDTCGTWSMTPTGCPQYLPGWTTSGGATMLTWKLDLAPGTSAYINWKGQIRGTTNSGATIINEAAVTVLGQSSIVEGTGSSGAVQTASLTDIYAPPLALSLWHEPPRLYQRDGKNVVEYTLGFRNESNVSGFQVTLTALDGFTNRSMADMTWGTLSKLWVSGGYGVMGFSWTNTLAGTWDPVTDPTGQGNPFYLRWVLQKVGMHRSGYVRYGAVLETDACTVLPAMASATMWTGWPSYIPASAYSGTVYAPCPGFLKGALTFNPSGNMPAGNPFNVIFTVTNTGGTTTNGILPFLNAYSGASQLYPLSGPTPAGPVSLIPGAAQSFTWSFTASGSACFTATATGLDALNLSMTATGNGCMNVIVPGAPSFSVSKTHSPANPGGNAVVTYKIIVTNTGTETISNIRISDTLPTGVSVLSQSSTPFLTWNGSFGSPAWSGAVTINPGKSATLSVDAFTTPCLTSYISNTAYVVATSLSLISTDKTAVDSGFNITSQTPTSISLTQTRIPASVCNSGTVSYRLDIKNIGANTVTNIIIHDSLPAAVTFISENHPASLLLFTNDWKGLQWSLLLTPLAPNAVLSVTITGTASPTFTGIVSNTATAYGDNSCYSDMKTATDSFTLPCAGTPPVITISKSHSPANPVNGGAVTYQMVVTNAGTSAIDSLNIVDTLATQITYSGEEHPAGLAFSQTGQLLSWSGTSLALAPGATLTVTVTGTTALCYTGRVSNTAWVSASNAGGSAQAKSVDLGFNLVSPVSSMAIIKTHSPASPVNGGPVTYKTIITNTGLATITSLKVTDTLPATVSYSSQTSAPALVYNGSASIVSWSGALTLAPGASATLTISGTTALCYTGNVSNTAWALATSSCGSVQAKSLDSGFALATGTTAVAIFKTHSPANPGNGAPVTYRIVVINTGTGTLTSFTTVDTLPALFAFTGEDHQQTPGLVFANAGQILSWNGNVSLAPGSAFTLTVTGTTSACAGGVVSNIAWVYAQSACAGAQAKAVDSGFTLPSAPVLSITKTALTPTVVTGNPASYRIVVGNIGASALTSFKLSDTLPADFIYSGEEHSAGLSSAVTGALLSWNLSASLAPGQTWTITVSGTVSASASGTFNDTSWCWGSNGTCTRENTVTAAISVTPALTSAAVAMAVIPVNPVPGSAVSYLITITNNGTVPLTGVWVSDTLPASFLPTGESHPAGLSYSSSGNLLWWDGPVTLAPGAVLSITITGTLSASASGVVSNTASVSVVDGSGGTAATAQTLSITVTPPLGGGTVLIVGGTRGYFEPGLGKYAQIMVRPTGAGTITVNIYTMAGVDVIKLVKSVSGPTTAVLTWDGNDKYGHPVPAGVYPVFIDGPGIKRRSKLVLVR